VFARSEALISLFALGWATGEISEQNKRHSIHDSVSELMPAKNFYIALYDAGSETISFPYFVDERDEAPAPRKRRRGLTEYVLRTGEALLAPPEVLQKLIQRGEAELIGAPAVVWLGVPLKVQEKTIGVLVVQSYTEGMID